MEDPDISIYFASKEGNRQVIDTLLNMGAKITWALLGACEGGHFDLVHLLIDKGINVLNKSDNLQAWNFALGGACLSGHVGIVQFIMDKGVNNFNIGLQGACQGGHLNLIQLMIDRGANEWNFGLRSACRGGHINVVQMMIDRGANEWNCGFYGACENGSIELVQLMIDKGAYDWDSGLFYACVGGHKKIVQMMIAKGEEEWRKMGIRNISLQPRIRNNPIAYTWNEGLEGALKNGHHDMALLMIEKGATYKKYIFQQDKKFIMRALLRVRGKLKMEFQELIKEKVKTPAYFINRHALRCDKQKLSNVFNVGQQFACKDVATFILRFSSI